MKKKMVVIAMVMGLGGCLYGQNKEKTAALQQNSEVYCSPLLAKAQQYQAESKEMEQQLATLQQQAYQLFQKRDQKKVKGVELAAAGDDASRVNSESAELEQRIAQKNDQIAQLTNAQKERQDQATIQREYYKRCLESTPPQ